MNNWIDYYEILGVSKDASLDEIKGRYHDLLKEYHPDVYEGDDAHEKAALINESYDILSDESKRASYNLDYDKHKDGEYSEPEEEIDYEEVIKNYTEKEKKFAKQLAIKKLIEEALIKIENIKELKNDILIAAYSNSSSEKEYGENVQELLDICSDYIEELEMLKAKASENELDSLFDGIDNVIEEVKTEMHDIPYSVLEATNYVDDEIIKNDVNQQINIDIKKANEFLNSLDIFFYQIKDNISSEKQYNSFYQRTVLKLNEIEAKLLNMKKLAKLFSFNPEFEKIDEILKTLVTKKLELPDNYEGAKTVSKIIIFNNKILAVSNKMMVYRKKFEKIEKIITKHPFNRRSFALADYASSLYKEIRREIGQDVIKMCEEGEELSEERQIDMIKDIYKSAYELAKKTSDDFNKVKKTTKKAPNFDNYQEDGYYFTFTGIYKKRHDDENRKDISDMLYYISEWSKDILESENFEEMYYEAFAYFDKINNKKYLTPSIPDIENFKANYRYLLNLYYNIDSINSKNQRKLFAACHEAKPKNSLQIFYLVWHVINAGAIGVDTFNFVTHDYNPYYLLFILIVVWPIFVATKGHTKLLKQNKQYKTYKKTIETVPGLKQKYEYIYGKL